MLDAGIAVPRIMQICGCKTMSTFLRYAMTGRNVLRPELETRTARTGKTEGMETDEQTRASNGTDKLYSSHSRRKGLQSVAPSSRPASRGKSWKTGKIAGSEY
jgi:hypothetical protein